MPAPQVTEILRQGRRPRDDPVPTCSAIHSDAVAMKDAIALERREGFKELKNEIADLKTMFTLVWSEWKLKIVNSDKKKQNKITHFESIIATHVKLVDKTSDQTSTILKSLDAKITNMTNEQKKASPRASSNSTSLSPSNHDHIEATKRSPEGESDSDSDRDKTLPNSAETGGTTTDPGTTSSSSTRMAYAVAARGNLGIRSSSSAHPDPPPPPPPADQTASQIFAALAGPTVPAERHPFKVRFNPEPTAHLRWNAADHHKCNNNLWSLVADAHRKKGSRVRGKPETRHQGPRGQEFIMRRCDKLGAPPPPPPVVHNCKVYEKENEEGEIVEYCGARLWIDLSSLELFCNRQFWLGRPNARPWVFPESREKQKDNVESREEDKDTGVQ